MYLLIAASVVCLSILMELMLTGEWNPRNLAKGVFVYAGRIPIYNSQMLLPDPALLTVNLQNMDKDLDIRFTKTSDKEMAFRQSIFTSTYKPPMGALYGVVKLRPGKRVVTIKGSVGWLVAAYLFGFVYFARHFDLRYIIYGAIVFIMGLCLIKMNRVKKELASYYKNRI